MTQAKRTPPRLLEVVHVEDLSPSMRRIHLSGEQLNHFPHNSDGAHIKLMLPQAHQQSPVLPTLGEQGPFGQSLTSDLSCAPIRWRNTMSV